MYGRAFLLQSARLGTKGSVMTDRRKSAASWMSILFTLSLPTAALAQNLVVNGDFASTLLPGWTFPDAQPMWSAFDVNGALNSGSAFGTNSAAAAGARVYVLRQCVSITQPGLYVLGVSAFTPTGQVDGDLLFTAIARANAPTCSGSFFNESGLFLPSIGQWQRYTSGTLLQIPAPLPADTTVEVLLGLDKTPAGGSFSGYFDAVSLARDVIYGNGFE
jgi:hypothetical protein